MHLLPRVVLSLDWKPGRELWSGTGNLLIALVYPLMVSVRVPRVTSTSAETVAELESTSRAAAGAAAGAAAKGLAKAPAAKVKRVKNVDFIFKPMTKIKLP